MQGKNGVVSTGIIGVIIIAFSLAAFFLLNIEKTDLNKWALFFLLLSEITFFAGLILLRYSKAHFSNTFTISGITASLSLYFVFTLISLLFVSRFKEMLNTFILIEIALIALFAIIIIVISMFSRVIERRNEDDLSKVGNNEPRRGGF